MQQSIKPLHRAAIVSAEAVRLADEVISISKDHTRGV